jgi:2-methylcitrate dehydratase PrpD
MSAPDAFNPRGFGGTACAGAFGAAAVAARLLGLDREMTADAFGIAGGLSAGLIQWAEEGSWTKRLQAGWASYIGIHAALLAQQKFASPRRIMEGRLGFLNSHVGLEKCNLAALTEGLGELWHIRRISTKPYPACHNLHTFMDAAVALKRTHGIEPEDVERVDCVVPLQQEKTICIPWEQKLRPLTEYGAQFSLPFAVATVLVAGRGSLREFGPTARSDPRVLALADRVRYTNFDDPGWPGRHYGEVRIRTRDGRDLRQVETSSRGSPERPLSSAELEEKFLDNVVPVWGRERALRILRAIAALHEEGRIATLMHELE